MRSMEKHCIERERNSISTAQMPRLLKTKNNGGEEGKSMGFTAVVTGPPPIRKVLMMASTSFL